MVYIKYLFMLSLPVLTWAYAQSDEIVYNPETRQLSYVIDYNRLAENAIARDCSMQAFENGLLHSVLRHLILFMPYEASFYTDVQTLDIRVVQQKEDPPVLYASMSLEEARSINTKFRVFMNSFASPRSGFCFAMAPSILETWVSTLLARRGVLAYDKRILQIEIAQAKDITELNIPGLSAAAEPAASQNTASQSEPPVSPPEPAAEPAMSSSVSFKVTPYLSEIPVLNFTQGQWVLKPDTDYAAIIATTQGTMTLELFEVQAPNTVNNFVFLALNQFYDGVSFFRVIEDFMAQTGDPSGTGLGTPGYQFADEVDTGFSHSTKGVVSMANAGPNTNGSQFFITLEATPWLDGQYSVFGAVTDGLDVLDKLQRTNPDAPLAIAPLDSSLGLLETQGINLSGNDAETLSAYITRLIRSIPEPNQRFKLDSYDVVIMIDPQSGNPLAVFYPKSDTIEHVYILERAM